MIVASYRVGNLREGPGVYSLFHEVIIACSALYSESHSYFRVYRLPYLELSVI